MKLFFTFLIPGCDVVQMFSDIRKFTELIEPNSTLTLSPGKGTDMQAQDS